MAFFNLKMLYLTVRALISAVLLFYLVSIIDWDRLAALLLRIDKKFLSVAPILLFVGLLFSSIRWRHLLACLNIGQNIKRLFAYYLIGNFYSIFLPGVIGGDIVRIGICASETKSPLSIIMASVVIERACGVIILFIIGSLFVIALPPEIFTCLGPPVTKTLPLVTVFGLFAISIISLLLRISSKKFTSDGTGWGNKFMQIINLGITLPYSSVFILILFSALFQLSDILASFIIAKALNIHLPLSLFFVIIPFVYIGTLLPVSLGGLGVREGTFVYLLAKVGIIASDAVALAFLIYFNRIIIGSFGGIIHIFLKREGVSNRPNSMHYLS